MVQFKSAKTIEGTQAERLALTPNDLDPFWRFTETDTFQEFLWDGTVWQALPQQIPDFEDDYNSDVGWTQVGGNTIGDRVVVDSAESPGVALFDDISNNADHRVHKALGLTLSDDVWFADFEFTFSALTGDPQMNVYTLSAGTGDPAVASQDALGVLTNPQGFNLFFKDGAGGLTFGGTTTTALTLGTNFFCRLERVSSILTRINVYTDAARTIHFGNSPQTFAVPATVIGLTTLQHSGASNGSGGSRFITAEIDNTKIFNGVEP